MDLPTGHQENRRSPRTAVKELEPAQLSSSDQEVDVSQSGLRRSLRTASGAKPTRFQIPKKTQRSPPRDGQRTLSNANLAKLVTKTPSPILPGQAQTSHTTMDSSCGPVSDLPLASTGTIRSRLQRTKSKSKGRSSTRQSSGQNVLELLRSRSQPPAKAVEDNQTHNVSNSASATSTDHRMASSASHTSQAESTPCTPLEDANSVAHITPAQTLVRPLLSQAPPPRDSHSDQRHDHHDHDVNSPMQLSPARTPNAHHSEPCAPGPSKTINDADMQAIQKVVDGYRELHGLTQYEANALIHGNANKEGKELWETIRMAVPHISSRQLLRKCRGKFHNFVARGTWTAEQDEELKLAFEHFPYQWTKVGAALNRLGDDCRDRWRNYGSMTHQPKHGPWTNEEEEELRRHVRRARKTLQAGIRKGEIKASQTMGLEELIDWAHISEQMGENRSRQQCLYKYKQLKIREESEGEEHGDAIRVAPWRLQRAVKTVRAMNATQCLGLLHMVRASNAGQERLIPWEKLGEENDDSSKGMRMAWRLCLRHLQEMVPDHAQMKLQDIVQTLIDAFEESVPNMPDGYADWQKLRNLASSQPSLSTPKRKSSGSSASKNKTRQSPAGTINSKAGGAGSSTNRIGRSRQGHPTNNRQKKSLLSSEFAMSSDEDSEAVNHAHVDDTTPKRAPSVNLYEDGSHVQASESSDRHSHEQDISPDDSGHEQAVDVETNNGQSAENKEDNDNTSQDVERQASTPTDMSDLHVDQPLSPAPPKSNEVWPPVIKTEEEYDYLRSENVGQNLYDNEGDESSHDRETDLLASVDTLPYLQTYPSNQAASHAQKASLDEIDVKEESDGDYGVRDERSLSSSDVKQEQEIDFEFSPSHHIPRL